MTVKTIKPLLLVFLIIVYGKLHAQSPGGVTRHTVWLKGNTTAPNTGAINFNPLILPGKEHSRAQLPSYSASLRRVTIFTVYQGTSNSETPVWGVQNNTDHISLSTRQVSSGQNTAPLVFAKENSAATHTGAYMHTYVRRRGSMADEDAEAQNALFRLGSPNTAVAECILYNKVLNEQEIARVETYLALKYGITLEKNYTAVNGDILWDYKKNTGFSNNITGIGREDAATLYQKQSTSSNSPGQLVMGVYPITGSNNTNTGNINNGDYLVWGDNAQPLLFSEQNGMWLSERKWLLNPSGATAAKLNTEVQFNTTHLPNIPKERFCLVIDRSGTGNFTAANYAYIFPESISPEGIATFKNVQWDADGSGYDQFAFGLEPEKSHQQPF